MKTFMKRFIPLLLVACLIMALGCVAFAADEECTEETCDLPFEDVAVEAWYHAPVHYVYEQGMMYGTSETTFSPDLEMTRGMLVAVLYRMQENHLEQEEIPASNFVDVDPDIYYAEAIDWAAYYGVVLGFDEEHFGPDEVVTREQAATILFRYATVFEKDNGLRVDLDAFPDAGDVCEWAEEAYAWAVKNEIIYGTTTEDGTVILNPHATSTRAQVAALINRYCIYLGLFYA